MGPLNFCMFYEVSIWKTGITDNLYSTRIMHNSELLISWISKANKIGFFPAEQPLQVKFSHKITYWKSITFQWVLKLVMSILTT